MVIINGEQYDPELRARLERDHRIRVHYRTEASFPNAVIEGRRLVETEYYGFLDDDDILLEESVCSRIRRFHQNHSLDVVVGNGYKYDQLGFPNNGEMIRSLEADPFEHLVKFNWLASCGGLYKTDSIGVSYFEDSVMYYEWTYLAFRLALSKKIGFVGEPTYKIFSSAVSLSKTDQSIEGQLGLITKLKRLNVSDRKAKVLLDQFFCQCYHTLSDHYRLRNDSAKAWKYHLRSLSTSYGLRFIPYSRHLLMDSMRKLFIESCRILPRVM